MTSRSRPFPPAYTLEYVLGADPAVVRGYARAAHDLLAGGGVTLKDRDAFLRRGERLGLSRFDANLVLAAVTRQVQNSRPPMRLVRPAEPRASKFAALATVLGVQASIVAAVAWLVL